MKVMLGMWVMYLPMIMAALFAGGTALLLLRQRSLPALFLFLGFTGPFAIFLLPTGSAGWEARLALTLVCGLLQLAGILGLAHQPRLAPATPG